MDPIAYASGSHRISRMSQALLMVLRLTPSSFIILKRSWCTQQLTLLSIIRGRRGSQCLHQLAARFSSSMASAFRAGGASMRHGRMLGKLTLLLTSNCKLSFVPP